MGAKAGAPIVNRLLGVMGKNVIGGGELVH